MNFKTTLFVLLLLSLACQRSPQTIRFEMPFDGDWKFFLGDIEGAEKPEFDDRSWRDIDLPHDWSIETLSGQEPGKVVGPFSKESPGATATGYTLGGSGWYRKTFILTDNGNYDKTIVNFDGVYMNCDVWVNGTFLGSHPYGYTAFGFDISSALNKPGEPNVMAVKVKNEGKNSRWYSGSGIYRHVWLIRKQAVYIPQNGVSITTENISPTEAAVKIRASVKNTAEDSRVKLLIKITGPDGKIKQETETQAKTISSNMEEFVKTLIISQPELWSLEKPNLYKAEIEVVADGIATDQASVPFGIRTIHFDAQSGFTLNGYKVLLKGGCMHHDNGFLGSAAIDRAEERRVELMKAYGFNAIRTSHNPPSKQFLDACDRNGILVIDEAFDTWERPKNPEDYHLYFKDWWAKDLESMILRDRNHPSVILWSIGNEINERADSAGYITRKKLVDAVHKLDPTRPVTEAICGFWDHPGQDWSTTAPAFASLDIGGYNYLWATYEADHVLFPERIMMGTESFPREVYDNWKQVEKNPWVIGDFVWTAMDYLGETGIGHSRLDDDPDRGLLRPWPWFNAHCGDIDLCGFKKPQLLYKDVVWHNSRLEMAVHSPLPEGKKEIVNYWGWPDEVQSWNWDGHEGEILDVRVFTSYPVIRLEINGTVITEKTVSDKSKLIAEFKVPYEAGVLKAVALENGKEIASKELRTTGKPARIKFIADRDTLNADRNDLSYVEVEILDAQGNLAPDARVPVTLSVSGVGEIAGSGNACPYDMESFNNPVCQSYRGQALVILRPLKGNKTGTITLRGEAKGLATGEIKVAVQ